MSDRPHRLRLPRGSVSVGVVLLLSAVLFSMSARSAAGSISRHPTDLRGLTQAESDKVARLSAQVDELRAEVDVLTAQSALPGASADAVGTGYLVAGGGVPVSGIGLTVQLNDAPADSPRRGNVSPDVLVVHQQDLQAVMNALWAGGAEAMELQDQRVVSTSAFRCVGNVLRLHGRVYSPPYTVRAIGDPHKLQAALDQAPAVRAYVRDSVQVGLGWQVAESSSLQLPAYSVTDLTYASVPAGVQVLPGLPEPSATAGAPTRRGGAG
ncbi:hypothetical protein CELL_00243 [Cellulomonas sp. T2.31MG-18]|uniref:DUF881 domain-containing protein n=1 Tax=Cellulomonas sp. T2.31MG-18 TaxID=3157619 RepID=UPI0035EE998F